MVEKYHGKLFRYCYEKENNIGKMKIDGGKKERKS